jgi:hypothetical protein
VSSAHAETLVVSAGKGGRVSRSCGPIPDPVAVRVGARWRVSGWGLPTFVHHDARREPCGPVPGPVNFPRSPSLTDADRLAAQESIQAVHAAPRAEALPPHRLIDKQDTPPAIRMNGRGAGEPLPGGERARLIAIAQHHNGLRREQLTVLTGCADQRAADLEGLREFRGRDAIPRSFFAGAPAAGAQTSR